MVQFFQTRMGEKFYQGDVPEILRQLHKISNELSRANDLKEKELKMKEYELELYERQIRKENKINV